MEDIRETVARVRERIIRSRGSRAMNEENTKATLVEPILRALGWDVENLDEVRREFKPKRADNPVDYALLLLRTPRFFVEAKALGQNLDERRWANQIMGYATVAGVEWIVLTDGDEYRIFNSHAAVAVEEKLFRTVRISDEKSGAEETLWLLSKEQLKENRIEALWNAYFVDRQVRRVVEDLFGDDPDPSLIRLVTEKTSKVSRKDIQASLGRARIHMDFPVEEIETVRPRAPKDRPAQNRSKQPESAVHRPGVSLSVLIGAGVIRAPLRLERTYKGHTLSAEVDESGTVAFGGKRYNSLSLSAGAARASIIGAPVGRKYHQTNGWTFWKFRDADGESKPVDALR